MEKLLKIPYKVFNDWDQLQLFLTRQTKQVCHI